MVKVIDPDNYKVFNRKSCANFILLELFMIGRLFLYIIIKFVPELWYYEVQNARVIESSTELVYIFLEFVLIQYFICLKAINLKQELKDKDQDE